MWNLYVPNKNISLDINLELAVHCSQKVLARLFLSVLSSIHKLSERFFRQNFSILPTPGASFDSRGSERCQKLDCFAISNLFSETGNSALAPVLRLFLTDLVGLLSKKHIFILQTAQVGLSQMRNLLKRVTKLYEHLDSVYHCTRRIKRIILSHYQTNSPMTKWRNLSIEW